MFEKITFNFLVAVEALTHNKLRSFLTSLGIIFGVASVISMLAIGKGAELEILQQIKLLGANNIIITPIVEQQEGPVSEAEEVPLGNEKRPFSPGLTLQDAESIQKLVPGVSGISPEIILETTATRAGLRRSTKLVGVDRAYFEGSDFKLDQGQFFTPHHIESSAPVCIIGQSVKSKYFPQESPLGKRIKTGHMWLTVIGILEPRNIATQSIERLGIRNYDLDIYAPITTVLLRFENRAALTATDVQRAERERSRGTGETENYHQLDRLVVKVDRTALMRPIADVISRMLERRHYGVIDYEVIVPETLLKQERRTQNIFNMVLAAIASISLLVGGIGIMNIMLASVLERIKEIGIRRSVGATSQDVIAQFLIESTTLSVAGGLLGIAFGLLFSAGIEWATDIKTMVSVWAVLLAFVVSAGIGLLFGFLPARKAAEQDPVEAMRHA